MLILFKVLLSILPLHRNDDKLSSSLRKCIPWVVLLKIDKHKEEVGIFNFSPIQNFFISLWSTKPFPSVIENWQLPSKILYLGTTAKKQHSWSYLFRDILTCSTIRTLGIIICWQRKRFGWFACHVLWSFNSMTTVSSWKSTFCHSLSHCV